MHLGSLESTQEATPRATLTLLSCSPNFPRASITRYTVRTLSMNQFLIWSLERDSSADVLITNPLVRVNLGMVKGVVCGLYIVSSGAVLWVGSW